MTLPGPRGEAGRRALALVRVQLGFYLLRDLFAAKDWSRALVGLELAAAAAPDDAALRYNLACAQARTGRRAEALEESRRAVQLSPASSRDRANLGEMLRDLGHHQEALQAFREAVLLAPGYAPAWLGRLAPGQKKKVVSPPSPIPVVSLRLFSARVPRAAPE